MKFITLLAILIPPDFGFPKKGLIWYIKAKCFKSQIINLFKQQRYFSKRMLYFKKSLQTLCFYKKDYLAAPMKRNFEVIVDSDNFAHIFYFIR